MRLKKKVIFSVVASAAALIVSTILPIIPCRIAPNLPNPIYTWSLCNLNPGKIGSLNSIKEYFGYTTSLTDAYLATFLILFIALMVFFHFTIKKRKGRR